MSRVLTLGLYRSLLRESKGFSSYNFREYALRRTRDAFREHRVETDATKVAQLLDEAKKSLDLIRRQVSVGKLYQEAPLMVELVGMLPVLKKMKKKEE